MVGVETDVITMDDSHQAPELELEVVVLVVEVEDPTIAGEDVGRVEAVANEPLVHQALELPEVLEEVVVAGDVELVETAAGLEIEAAGLTDVSEPDVHQFDEVVVAAAVEVDEDTAAGLVVDVPAMVPVSQ
jgi:hypothetical protein